MKRFGVLSCNDDRRWGGSETVVSRYFNCYSTNAQEDWVGFHVCRGEAPSAEDILKFDGFLITGSEKSANDQDEWIQNLKEFIRRVAAIENNRPKTVGICFGHQLMTKALGGKVGANPDKDFVLQTEELISTSEAAGNKFMTNLFKNGPLRVAELHGECVTELPEGAVSLATSSSCKYEIIQFNEDMIGIQSHPNVVAVDDGAIAMENVSKAFNWDNEKIKKSTESLSLKCNHEDLNNFIKKFLHGNKF